MSYTQAPLEPSAAERVLHSQDLLKMIASPIPPSEPSAAQRVLETPELLEMIISCLPEFQILVSQRVSQMWRGVTANSPQIQRMLFLRPDWNLEAKPFNAWKPINRPGARPKNNRMLRRVLDGVYPTVTLKVTNDNEEQETAGNVTAGDSSSIEVPRKEKPTTGHWSWDVNITYPADVLLSSDPAVSHKNASWRKMFICQPPCTSLHLVRRWQKSHQPAMECESGITMDFFVDKASKAKEVGNGLFVSSDGGIHFEGSVKCSSIEESEAQLGTKEVVYDEWVLERLMGIGYLANHH